MTVNVLIKVESTGQRLMSDTCRTMFLRIWKADRIVLVGNKNYDRSLLPLRATYYWSARKEAF
jgi:hypothetical protein